MECGFHWQVNQYSYSRIGGILHLADAKEVKRKTGGASEELQPVGLRDGDECADLPFLVPVS